MAIPTDTESSGIVGSLLQAGIEEVEKAASKGIYNTMSIRALGSAAKVLWHEAIANRAIKLLRTTPDEMFGAGALTNIEITAAVPEQMRSIDDLEALEKRYPPYQADVLIERIR